MSRRLYLELSAALAEAKPKASIHTPTQCTAAGLAGWAAACFAVKNVLAHQSREFDADRFLFDCGVYLRRRPIGAHPALTAPYDAQTTKGDEDVQPRQTGLSDK